MLNVAYQMMLELNGVKYIYAATLDDCFIAVCKKFGLDPKAQNRDEIISNVRAALQVTY